MNSVSKVICSRCGYLTFKKRYKCTFRKVCSIGSNWVENKNMHCDTCHWNMLDGCKCIDVCRNWNQWTGRDKEILKIESKSW